MQEISLDRIRVQPGFNHRKRFCPAKHAALVESIKAQGVIQPVILRPDGEGEGGLYLVAGERRWRAAKDAELGTIPGIVRDLDDRAALAVSLIENRDREDITPAEEADTARRAVDAAEGDEAEAARILGWTVDRLKSRLLLLNAIPAALDALAERRIALGHCELLASLTEAKQAEILPKLIEKKVSVEVFREQLASYTQELSAAIFDKAGCNGCRFNSSQAQLFDTHVSEGRCANRECWRQKTEVALVERRTALKQDVAVIWFDREKDPTSYTPVSAATVGEGQYDTGCKGCGHFGSLMLTAAGKEGQVTSSLCFNTSCNQKKVAAHKASTAPSVPGKVMEIIDAFVREEAAKTVESHPRSLLAMQLYGLRTLAKDRQ